MVLTITLNPVLERKLFFEKINYGAGNRSKNERLNAGGKGINISRQLNLLGIDNLALSFAGGNNGKIFRSLIANEKINNVLSNTKSETRYSINIIEEENKNVTIYFSPNAEVSSNECDMFFEKYEKILPNASIVVFAGSCPSNVCEKFIPLAIEKANSLDKIVVVDTYGNHLSDTIESSPMVFHANISETEKSLNMNLSSEEEKIDFLKFLYNKGIKLAFLTDGSKEFFASKFDFIYKIIPPSVNEYDSTGSGDSFLSGIIYGLEKALVFDEFVKIAVSLGAANAEQEETCRVSLDNFKKYVDQVQIIPIGKKMKLIDDSPQK